MLSLSNPNVVENGMGGCDIGVLRKPNNNQQNQMGWNKLNQLWK